MNESEFRDYLRNVTRALDERITRLEKVPPPEAVKPPAKLVGDMALMAEHLLAEVRAGRVTGLAIAYLGEQPVTGVECVEGERSRLLGSAMLMVDELLAPSRVVAAPSQEAAA